MGSCYSCNSSQRGHAYTTVDMANTNSDNKLADPLKSRVCPYARGRTTSFGFNKKRIPTTLKSLSQDRTNEMVTNYESKIASINSNIGTGSNRISPRLNKYSHIPRFGFKPGNSTNSLGSSEELDSSNSSLNNSDPNSNNFTEKGSNKPLVNGLRTKFTETTAKNNNEQIVKRCNQDTIPEIRRPQSSKGFTQMKGPVVTNRPKSGGSRIAAYNSGLKQPTKVTTQASPKSMIRVTGEESDDKKKKGTKFDVGKAPLARFEDVEVMNSSSEMLPDEVFDSGLGTSDSDNKKEGDKETLAEINELASDNPSAPIVSGQHKKVIGMNATKHKKEMSISAPRITPRLHLVQKKISGKNDTKAVDLMKKITSRFHQEDDFADVKEEKTSTNEIMKNVNKGSREMRVDSNERKRSSAMQSSTGSISSPTDRDALSPPSERDTFLIDDEICDQPQLIQCQSPDLGSFLYSQELFGIDQDAFLEDGGKECMAFRSGSLDTLSSPSSSIGSNDLMLDFDQGEENTLVENLSSRRLSCEECEQNASENMKSREHCRHRSKSLRPQHDSSTLPLIDEWNSLLDTHSKDGASAQGRTRRLRAATTSDMPTNSETRVLRPPRKMSAIEMEDGGVVIDPSSFRLLSQDVTNLKTMLLKLKRVLQEAETLNPFECHSVWKNGLFHNLAHSDPPGGVDNQEEISQENMDLRRQVVFLQQQLDEKDRTILLLQQQMTKYTISKPVSSTLTNVTNTATQTDKPRLSLTSMSQTLEESSLGSTVSCKAMSRPKIPIKPKHLARKNSVTGSLNALPTVGQLTNNTTDQRPQNSSFASLERSASTGDLSKTTTAKADEKNNVESSQEINDTVNLPKMETAAKKSESSNSRPRSQIAAPLYGQKGLRYSQQGKKTINN